MDDELLQDFLVEAGEILEQLNSQLISLEQAPDDKDLLNAVFRGFHTIKGGAGFLNIDPMVALCHRTEDIFNLLRNGERHVTQDLMDTVLPVLDVLNDQFARLQSGDELDAADPALLRALEHYTTPGDAPAPAAAPGAEPKPEAVAAAGDEDITDEEFEALLDALDKPGGGSSDKPAATDKSDGDEINDDEFEALLDDLHGKGQFKGAPAADSAADKPAAAAGGNEPQEPISQDEFEALLDDLHGKGQFKGGAADAGHSAAAPPAAGGAGGGGNTSAATSAAPEPEEPQSAAAMVAKAAAGNKERPAGETSVRVDTARLDEIMNMVGELVLVRNRISRLGEHAGDEELSKAVANLDLVTSDLQLSVMKTRMQPIKKVFGRFPRVVRDMARSLEKEIHLEMIGEETDLDKNLVEALADPLVHLVRNSVDHGIEMPDVREAAGKPREGTVALTASQEGDHILLVIEDDGGGMDPNKLRDKAVEKGVMDADAAARLDDNECFNLIFAPGFSTKDQISDISGRGVGMDVVKTKITQLNGSIEIDSAPGKGTRLSIKVPLTLAIMSTLMVRLKDQLFALPLVNVSEIFHLDLTKTNIMDGQQVIIVREKTLPLFYLKRWLVKGEANTPLPNEGHVVIVHMGNQKIGFVVDELIGQEEVVIKPLGALLQGIPGLAGATITGDGGIAIILDVPGLMKMYT
ncbi:chemotaxis protein CheA [Thiohalophilus sp.]|uniref:chemotaxis protein CheA n=1 Tax=Thiohalophilus sp. TaxID=3028392 RepID=UPI002ACEE602|nr:chemotaxis protein CheA [Thiohalophilus sp.]MDZ7804183.1 chemotaxis protein CheA [Thiohalophilus sp.]